MTLQFEVKNQSLCVKQPLIVSDTINYIDAQFTFVTDDWKNLTSIWSHWKKGTTVYDVELSNGVAANLPLSTGEWEVYLHGSITQLNTVIYRVTTQIITIQVTNTGVLQGQPFAPTPTSAIEHLEARLDSLEESSVSATTLPVGSSATATKTVVDDHYNINFGIPKGDTGASGVEISNTQPTDPVVSVWINPSGTPSHGFVPSGGNAGQILAKASNTSYDVTWQNAPSSNDPRIGSLVANKFLKVSADGQSIQMADAGGENHLYWHSIQIKIDKNTYPSSSVWGTCVILSTQAEAYTKDSFLTFLANNPNAKILFTESSCVIGDTSTMYQALYFQYYSNPGSTYVIKVTYSKRDSVTPQTLIGTLDDYGSGFPFLDVVNQIF